jgi:hypothetical protein
MEPFPRKWESSRVFQTAQGFKTIPAYAGLSESNVQSLNIRDFFEIGLNKLDEIPAPLARQAHYVPNDKKLFVL